MKKQRLFNLSVILIAALTASSCSKKLPDETYPPEVTRPVETEAEVVFEETIAEETEASEVEETEPEETEPAHGPFSTAQVTERVVDVNGQLKVVGTDIVNENGDPIQLRGMSSYGINTCGDFFNKDTVQTLAEDWGCSVLRLAMYTVGSGGGEAYIRNPDKYFQVICDDIDLCIDQGIYVIVDWHILDDGDPLQYKEEAKDFFSRISAIYGDSPNIIYEICNEPNGESFADPEVEVGWENCIKPYAEEIIPVIRANDPDNIIIVGTPVWSSRTDEAAKSPLTGENLMYTMHFYAASHHDEHMDVYKSSIEAGLPLFCTEWGTTADSGNGKVDTAASDEWIAFMKENNISWCNWSIGGAKAEMSNALRFQSNILTAEEKLAGHWPDEFFSKSGYYVRTQILEIPYVPLED